MIQILLCSCLLNHDTLSVDWSPFMITLCGVTKTYKMGDETIYALKKVDSKIESGDFIAIVALGVIVAESGS